MTLSWRFLGSSNDDDHQPRQPALHRKTTPAVRTTIASDTARDDVDMALFERVRTGDEDAYQELFLALWSPLVAYAARLLSSTDRAVDLVQDVLAWVWEDRAVLSVHQSFRGYLYATVRRRALSMLRHERVVLRAHAATDDISPGMGAALPLGDAQLINAELHTRLRRAIISLPERGREIVILRWYHGLSHADIAGILGISKETVHVHLTRAMAILRRTMGPA